MKFTKEQLVALISEDYSDEFEIVHEEETYAKQMDVNRTVVFKYEGKFYEFEYSRNYNWGVDFDMISDEDLDEVRPVTKTIVTYERVTND